MKVSRRSALALAGAASIGTPMAARAQNGGNPLSGDPLSGEALYDSVVQYTQIGEHRTGTVGDLQTAHWLKSEFDDVGFATGLTPVSLNLFEVTAGFLEVDHHRYRADPEWYPTATPVAGTTAPLHVLAEGEDLSALNGKIWVTEVQMRRPVIEPEFKARAVAAGEAGALGVVMLLRYRSTELTGRGAHRQWGQAPWCPIPLVGVSAKYTDTILPAAQNGAMARLVVTGREVPDATAYNVLATYNGAPDDKYIVVTTPQSGMFRCGGERGGGIAVLVGLARWVAARQPRAKYLFSTNTGHEQDGSGARALLDNEAPPPEQVKAWLHLGAGVSTWLWRPEADGTFTRYAEASGIRNFGAVEELVPLLKEAFADIPDLEPQSAQFAGELGAYVRYGYPAFGFWGYNRFGHTVEDGPEHAAPELLEPVARALARALERIEQA